MSKPKILVCVIVQSERYGWVNPDLCGALLRLQLDTRFDLSFKMAKHPFRVEHARNMCMLDARSRGVNLLVQIDNDNTLPPNFGDILHETISTRKAVVVLGYGIPFPAHEGGPQIIPNDYGMLEGNFRVAGGGGGGVMLISSEVWKVIPRGPWFRWLTNEDEVESRRLGEDYYFAELVAKHGLRVWTHEHALAGHWKTMNVTPIAYAEEERKRVPRPTGYTRNPPPIVGRPAPRSPLGDME
jgi:hypothetical protein